MHAQRDRDRARPIKVLVFSLKTHWSDKMHTDGMSLLSLVFTAHKSLTKSPVLLAGENNSRKPSGFNWMTGNFCKSGST